VLEIYKFISGDCIEELKKLPENSVDAIITDPPYGLEFIGKEWDKFKSGKRKSFVGGGGDVTDKTNDAYMRINKTANRPSALTFAQKHEMQKFFYNFGLEAIRVLKHGGFLLMFGGTRTYHRLVCGIEDAGFEIRDTIMWLYGSGFPKSLNIGKQVDKIQGNKREVVGVSKNEKDFRDVGKKVKEIEGIDKLSFGLIENAERKELEITKGNSEWEGWGTALKPACEPIVVARKPLSEKNVALNVLKHGTGGINIDDCRIRTEDNLGRDNTGMKESPMNVGNGWNNNSMIGLNKGEPQGRFPANLILDEEAGRLLDKQSGVSKSIQSQRGEVKNNKIFGEYNLKSTERGHNDKGGASRFFYCAKASKSERNYGCEEMPDKVAEHHHTIRVTEEKLKEREELRKTHPEYSSPKRVITKNNHPTVKPIKLMEYLVKLVSKEGATVLDPFMGSGTTLIACAKLGRKGIGIEKELEYIEIAKARIKPYLNQTKLSGVR